MKKKAEQERKQVEVRLDVDTNRLYGDLEGAILYLREISQQYQEFNISLSEHWTGYEDMDMSFVYSREETDEEMASRLEHEERAKQYARREAKKAEERKADLVEYERLRSRLGIYR